MYVSFMSKSGGTQYSTPRGLALLLRLGAGLAAGEGASQALLQPGDEAGRAERPAGALAGLDRRVVGRAQALGEERPPVRREIEQGR